MSLRIISGKIGLALAVFVTLYTVLRLYRG